MCHQHVETDRAERASERNPATFEGPRNGAHVLPGAAGSCGDPPGPRSSSGEAGDPRPGSHETAGTSGYAARAAAAVREEAAWVSRAGSGLAGLSAGNRAARSWAWRARRVGAGKFLGVQPLRSGGYGVGSGRGRSLQGRVRCASCNPSRAGFGVLRAEAGRGRWLLCKTVPEPPQCQERTAGLMPRAARRGAHRIPNSKTDGS